MGKDTCHEFLQLSLALCAKDWIDVHTHMQDSDDLDAFGATNLLIKNNIASL
jgi:hypothetical protein